MLSILIIATSLLIGGFVRAAYGAGGLSLLPKWLGYLLTALLIAGFAHAPTLYPISFDNPDLFLWLWVSAIAALNLAAGYTRWECWWWQALRFGLPSIALILPLLFQNPSPLLLLYPLCVASIAACYPMRQRAFDLLHLPERSFQIPFTKLFITLDSARLAEFILGAAVLGGLAWLWG